MNILVTGGNGQLGNSLRVASRKSNDHYIFTDIWDLDITDPEAVETFIRNEKIDLVINCAAYTNVEQAEEDRERAEALNATAVGTLARAMASRHGFMIHISTDYVFGGEVTNKPFTEDAAPAPLNVYGLTKLHGEEALTASGCRHVILRTAWLYSEFGVNFVKRMLHLTETRPELNVVFDQIGTPTYAADLASVIFKICEERLYEGHEGLYHYTNEGVISWYVFACAIARIAGHTECKIRPCRSEEYPTKAVRPNFSILDKSKFKKTFSIGIPHWETSLERCINNLKG